MTNYFKPPDKTTWIEGRNRGGSPPREFARADKAVMLGQRCVCVATSVTMAKRICNALNQYTPNEKGY